MNCHSVSIATVRDEGDLAGVIVSLALPLRSLFCTFFPLLVLRTRVCVLNSTAHASAKKNGELTTIEAVQEY